MKKPYAKIYYNNCSVDYDYTIVPLPDIPDYIEVFKQDNEDVDEAGFNDWQTKGYLPSITISLVMMTDAEFTEWFVTNVENHA